MRGVGVREDFIRFAVLIDSSKPGTRLFILFILIVLI